VDFTALNLDPRLQRAIADRGFVQTTPIQSAVFPGVLAGMDLVACAQTGTGKTAAYLLPIMQRLLAAKPRQPADGRKASTRVLVLAPTRELAVQIEEDFDGFAYGTPLSGVSVYGGVGPGSQAQALSAPADVVVATPGRLLDHMHAGTGNFDGLEVLVLDEADRMLDMGFWPDVRRIVAALPADRQTLLFSATTSDDVSRSANQLMRNPKIIRIGRTTGLASTLTHVGHAMRSDEKMRWLTGFLRQTEGPTLVFVRTKHGADRLSRRLAEGHIRCTALHANRTQNQRTAAIEGFRSGRYAVLIATEIASRGLDIELIGHVVNYDVPATADAYVHRVGRTGRADACGIAVTLVAPEEMPALRSIESSLNLRLLSA
jgi:ATP-dependent RNA helicase RhlE